MLSNGPCNAAPARAEQLGSSSKVYPQISEARRVAVELVRRRASAPMIDYPWGVLTALGSRIPLASLTQTLAVVEYLNFRHSADAHSMAQSIISARQGNSIHAWIVAFGFAVKAPRQALA